MPLSAPPSSIFHGFNPEDILHISDNNLYSAHEQLGRLTKREAKARLRAFLEDLEELERARKFDAAISGLKRLQRLVKKPGWEIGGKNRLQRYLDAFAGYCAGANLSPASGALLQMELHLGCQSLIVQDRQTREVRYLHTEEEYDDYIIESLEDGEYPCKIVNMQLEEESRTFFSYPGICSWGPAFNVNETKKFIQLVDDIYIRDRYARGDIWHNAVTFMAFDCGDLKLVRQLFRFMETLLQEETFGKGYALNFIGEKHGAPEIAALEFANNRVEWLNPTELSGRRIFAHSNYPLSAAIQPLSESFPPAGKHWNLDDAHTYVEMNSRRKRLLEWGCTFDWLNTDAAESIRRGLELLASPEADVGGYVDENGVEHWKYFLGLPSRGTVAHLTGYYGKGAFANHIGKLVPAPLPGREYSLYPRKDYPFVQNKIWEMAEEAMRFHRMKRSVRLQYTVPPKLQAGDEVRILAPVLSLSTVDRTVQQQAKTRLEALGLRVSFGKHVYEKDDFGSSSVASRVEDLHDAFLDPRVKAIIPADGGFNSNQLFGYLDWELIRNSPKILTGYSDMTALQNAILAKSGLITYSGPLYWSLGVDTYYDYTKHFFEAACIKEEPYELYPNVDWDDDNDDRNTRETLGWPAGQFVIIQEGVARGVTIGGNIDTFGLLQGTPYMPHLDHSVVFFEDDYEVQPHHFDRKLQSFIQQPRFKGVKALLFGRFEQASGMTLKLFRQIIASKAELEGMPIVANIDFGHTYPKITLPIGGTATVRALDGEVKIVVERH